MANQVTVLRGRRNGTFRTNARTVTVRNIRRGSETGNARFLARARSLGNLLRGAATRRRG